MHRCKTNEQIQKHTYTQMLVKWINRHRNKLTHKTLLQMQNWWINRYRENSLRKTHTYTMKCTNVKWMNEQEQKQTCTWKGTHINTNVKRTKEQMQKQTASSQFSTSQGRLACLVFLCVVVLHATATATGKTTKLQPSLKRNKCRCSNKCCSQILAKNHT